MYEQYLDELDALWEIGKIKDKCMLLEPFKAKHPEIDNPGKVILAWIDSEAPRRKAREKAEARKFFAPMHEELKKIAGSVYYKRKDEFFSLMKKHAGETEFTYETLYGMFEEIYVPDTGDRWDSKRPRR